MNTFIIIRNIALNADERWSEMADLENVITLLDDMRMFADLKVHEIVSPDNWNVYSELCDLIDLTKENALSLLKAQDAVLVIQREVANMLFWCCGSCGVAITEGDRFCRICGRAVKWE